MIKRTQLGYFFILVILIPLVFISGCTNPPSQTNQSTWATYIDKADGVKISHPSDWSIVVSKVPPIKTESTSITMENVIHIYTPDTNGVVQITGFSYPTLVYSGDVISDEMYGVMTESFHKGPDGLTPVSVIKDDTAYVINGNSARHLKLNLIIDKTQMTSDVYIVRHKDIYYTLSYLVIDPSAQQYSETATAIMKTFKTVEWGK
jgi:hypothetical protein